MLYNNIKKGDEEMILKGKLSEIIKKIKELEKTKRFVKEV